MVLRQIHEWFSILSLAMLDLLQIKEGVCHAVIKVRLEGILSTMHIWENCLLFTSYQLRLIKRNVR